MGQELFAQARANGQDVIILNFDEGAIDMETNAQYVSKAVRYINSIKSGSASVKLAGVSMGGVVCRYALAEAEENGNPQVPSNSLSPISSPRRV